MRKLINMEPRSKTTSITMKPSVFEKMRKIAVVNSTGISSILNSFAEQYVIEHQADIEEYDRRYPECCQPINKE